MANHYHVIFIGTDEHPGWIYSEELHQRKHDADRSARWIGTSHRDAGYSVSSYGPAQACRMIDGKGYVEIATCRRPIDACAKEHAEDMTLRDRLEQFADSGAFGERLDEERMVRELSRNGDPSWHSAVARGLVARETATRDKP